VDYDVLADWHINIFCNVDCRYCCIHSSHKRDPRYKGHSPRRVVEGFGGTGLTWLIHASGGEPFLHPNFVQMSRELTRRHYLSINTNLSTNNIHRFAMEVDPGQVAFVHCSLHIEERARRGLVDDFVVNYHCLREAGFNTYVSQVMHPSVMDSFGNLFEDFQSRGVVVRPKVFRGYHRLRLYPAGYTQAQRETILKYCRLAEELDSARPLHIDIALDRDLAGGRLSFTGLPCRAGKDFVTIHYDGRVARCHSEPMDLGNIFEGRVRLLGEARPCVAPFCRCPYYGLAYGQGVPRILSADSFGDKMRHLRREVRGLRFRSL